MDRLVKQLITPFITEQVKAKKVIAVYPGRFQPFGPHHKKVFQSLQKKFDDVYITTSNIKSPPRHPMNFKEKVRHMVKMGIPKNKIIFEKSPYVANNLLKKFDSDKTAVVYVFGAKDAGRLKGGKKKSGGLTYYQDYKKNKNKMVGYETHGYIYTAPHVKVSGISSGTEIRRLLGSPKFGEKNREIIFKKTFGYFDKGVYNMLTNKFRKLFEVYSKFIVENKDYIEKLIKEASTGANFPTDDGPPTFYKGFNDYETESGKWIKEMGKTYGWEVYDYLISRTAQNPEDDYTLEMNIVPSVAFGRENTGDYGKRFGVKEPIKRYIEVADRISKQLGYEVIKYMGIKPDLSGYTGVEVEAPVLPGRYDLGNTKRAELTGKQLGGSGMTLLNTLKESLDLSSEVKMIFEDEKFKAKSKETGRIVTFKSKKARDKAVKAADVELLKKAPGIDPDSTSKPKKTKKVKGSDLFKKKQKPYKPVSDKPKVKKPSIDISKVMKQITKKMTMKRAAKNRPDRKPNMKNGVDVMRNPMDDDHFIGDFLYKTDKGVDLEKRNKNLKNQWSEEKKKLSKKEQKQLRKDVLSWKQLGGFEAIEEAIRTGETTPEEIKKRNERISDLSHKTITKVDTPIERGISVPNEVADEILSNFKVGEMVEIPDENGHGSSGFSTSEETARGFAKVDDGDSEKTSIIFRIKPNSKGEVRGAFIDGEPDDNDPPGFWTEEEITRSSKSKAEVVSVETKKLTNGKIVKIVTLQEPEDLTETIVKELNKKYSDLSRRYLEGPINPKPQKKKLQHECIAFSKKFGDDIVIGKNRDRNYTPELKVVREISGNGIEVCYVQDQDTDWSEGMNSNGIGLVNSALFVKRDEKDFDKAKKKKAPSKDGIRIRHALSKDTFAEVVESLVKFDTGVKGHTLVSNGKKLVVIENTSRTKPSVKIHDIDKSSIVRTNHGIKHPEQGYTRGPDRISSELRLKNAKELIDNEKEYKKVFPLFYNDTQDKGPKFDLVRAQNKLWTSSQILMNLNKKQLILYLIPGAVKFIGIENKLPKNYEPKINLDVRQYEHGPSDKYDTFITTDKTPKKSAIKDKSINENLLLEGGAYGHMSHPFDDKKLTFSDLKKIIKLGLSGELNREDNVTEKTDGQNLMITYRDGKVLAARNKGQIKNRGQNALDAKGIAQKFSGRGDIKDAFVFAMKDLTKAINSLSDKQKDKIFKNGEIFMNLEIIYPASSNVIDYDRQILQFHNSIQYDKNGNAVGEVKGSGRMLQGMIKQVNQDIGKHFKIIKPRVLALPKKIDFGKKVDIYNKRVDKLKNQYGLSDNDTLGKYHQSFWEEYIFNAGQQFGYRVPKTILKKLTKRWAFFDKSYKIPQMKKDLKKQPKFLEWVLNTDKQDHKNMVKKNMLPFEKIFFSVGADILENLSNFIAANPTKAVEKIRKEVLKASKAVRKAKDVKKMITLKQQLEKLNSIGGLKKIVPVEGIVFKYKGNTYKFTGAFAPVNQILGLVSF